MSSPQVVVIGGPNGAGKTTSARRVVGDLLAVGEYVNADVIAAGLSGFDPASVALEAGKIMLNRLHELAASRTNFAFETTLATRSFAPWISLLRREGYEFNLLYVWLKSSTLAIERVKARVAMGGHHVDDETVRRRYHRSVSNLMKLYIPIANRYTVLDNSRAEGPVLVAEGIFGTPAVVHLPAIWKKMLKEVEDGPKA